MIRREAPDAYWLVTQHDHALLAGRLIREVGGSFTRPPRFDETAAATDLHDSGWPEHDDHPTLNPQGLPLDVFEVSRPIAMAVWAGSARRAAEHGPYAQMLVSMHVLSLSAYAVSNDTPGRHEHFDAGSATQRQLVERFEINKFQHAQIELQETLRRKLGMSLDRPLEVGLAEPGVDRGEDELRQAFRLLQAMDLISLAICCTEPPTRHTNDVHTSTGARPTRLSMRRTGSDVTVWPWPFAEPVVQVEVPYRAVPKRAYASQDELDAVYQAAPVERWQALVRPEPGWR